MQSVMTITASLQAVSEFTTRLDNLLESLPTATRVSIVLAIQELCVNIVKHAYAGHPGTIEIEMNHTVEKLICVFRDQAPTMYTMPAVIEPPDPLDLPEHGMGMFIIHQAFDSVTYEHSSNGNRWQLEKGL